MESDEDTGGGREARFNFGRDVAAVDVGLCEGDSFNPEARVLVSIIPSGLQSSRNVVVDCTSTVPIVVDELCAEVILDHEIRHSRPLGYLLLEVSSLLVGQWILWLLRWSI